MYKIVSSYIKSNKEKHIPEGVGKIDNISNKRPAPGQDKFPVKNLQNHEALTDGFSAMNKGSCKFLDFKKEN